MATIINNLLPYRDYDEHDVINNFALGGANGGTGVAGTLLSLSICNPDSGDGYTNIPVGFAYPLTNSLRYATNNRVVPSSSGDTTALVLGLQIKDVREYDENGEILKFHPEQAERLNCVLSGQSTLIARKGLFTVSSRCYSINAGADTSTPAIGKYVVPSNSGSGYLAFVSPSQVATSVTTGGALTGQYQWNQIIGKCLSSSGSHFSGYAWILLDAGA